MSINKDALNYKIKKISSEKGVPSNVVLHEYFFDSFIKRLAKSKYKDNFVFKGGFLLSVSLGIDFRSTMDIDFLLTKIKITRENIIKIFTDIVEIDVNDKVSFEFMKIEDIRHDDKYGGFTICFLAKLENIKATLNIDVATGDVITPSLILYEYQCMFDKETLVLNAYNFETIIAEKLQTILVRGVANSRCKDFYDLYIIFKLKWDVIDIFNLKDAFKNTCDNRKTSFTFNNAKKIQEEIERSEAIIKRWNLFVNKNSYAKGISFLETISVVKKIFDIIYN